MVKPEVSISPGLGTISEHDRHHKTDTKTQLPSSYASSHIKTSQVISTGKQNSLQHISA